MNSLVLVFIIPLICGVLGFVIYRLRNEFNFLGAILTLYYSLYLFIGSRSPRVFTHSLFTIKNVNFGFYLDQLSGVIILGIALITFLILLYSFRYMRGFKNLGSYYLYFMFTLAVTNGIILSNNLIMFLFFSFILAILLYAFLIISSQDSLFVAHQTFLINVLFNIMMSLGIYLLLYQTGNIFMIAEPRILPSNSILIIAIVLVLLGVIGKIGLIPLNFWTTKLTKSPVTIITFIPMILEKIIGIYLLFRLSYYIININQTPLVRIIVLLIGGISILYAGFKAVKTTDIYCLLNYSAMIQFGFIFIGIGCANSMGLAGAIFHSINYLIFQPSLLLTSGSIEYWTKTTQIDNFHGLASKMPLTFFALLIAVLATIGIPPLNGFFSKWLLFQGIIKMNGNGFNIYSLIFILITCFGCLITPIYFLRLLIAFKGKETKYSQRVRDPGFTMSFSPVMLSILCIILGAFTSSFAMKTMILPSIGNLFNDVSLSNLWTFNLAPILLIGSILIGIIIFYTRYLPTKSRSFV